MNLVAEILGWAGMLLILVAYYLVSVKKVTGDSDVYQALNLIGAVGLIVNVAVHRAWPSVALNLVWGAIAVKTLLANRD